VLSRVISRPPVKPMFSTVLSAIDSNQRFQSAMIAGVGVSKPKCTNMNRFTVFSWFVFLVAGAQIGASFGGLRHNAPGEEQKSAKR